MGDILEAPFRHKQDLFGDKEAALMDPIGGALIGTEAKKLIAPLAEEPTAPQTLIEPGVMPTPSQAARQSRRKSYASQLARKGRASTVLTQADDDSLGAA